MVDVERRVFKKGQILYKANSFEPNMFNILYGRVAVYLDYKTHDEQKTMELGEGDFLNVISFLEIRPRHTTVVALEKTEVGVITRENCGLFFRDQPAKVMSLLQHMSARIRMMEKNYLRASEALERHADMDKVKAEDGAWYKEHSGMYQIIKNIFALENGHEEES